MAVRFSETVDGVTYEVRTAGQSVRLYTNDAFHTQFHPKHLFTGAVWDLLTLPSLCLPESPKRILVLGVAGGTVIHQLQRLHQDAIQSTTGIELDAVHIKLSKQFFELNYENLNIVQADGREWLETSQDTFDYIVDDIFLHGEDDPERPFDAGKPWFKLLKSHLAEGGVIVQNHISTRDAHRAYKAMGSKARKQGSAIGFETEGYDNRVLAWFDGARVKDLSRNLQTNLDQLPKGVTRKLRHHVRSIRA